MDKKYTLFISAILIALVLVGAGCNKGTDIKSFYQKHCAFVFETDPEFLSVWGSNKEECVKKYLENEKQLDELCESISEKDREISCDEAREQRLNRIRESVTKDGCIKNQKGFKCFIWDIEANTAWQETSAEDQEMARQEFAKCMAEAESYCSIFPDKVPY